MNIVPNKALLATLGTALLAASLFAAGAKADDFIYTGSIQTYNVVTTGNYSFTLSGAQGGNSNGGSGGMGIVLNGDITLTAGTTLQIVVGGQGLTGNFGKEFGGGGGGGSFVFVSGDTQPLIVAGGGGGAGYGSANGSDGSSSTNGTNGQGTNGGNGGTSGTGGAAGNNGFYDGGGGGGWVSNGADAANAGGIQGGGGGGSGPASFAGGGGATDGSGDYATGGFGGGGGGGYQGGGGGGGYSGGGGGDGSSSFGGGGGGSYLDASITNSTFAATNTGNGSFLISLPGPPATVFYWDVNGPGTGGFGSINGTWTAGNDYWNSDSTGGNGGSIIDLPTSADDLNISAGTTGTITISGTGTASSLSISDNVAVTITGGTLALGGSGSRSGLYVDAPDSADTTVSSAITLNNGPVFIQNNGAGVLTVSGGITGAEELDLKNNGATADAVTISGADVNTSGKIYNLGSGASVLISANVDSNVTAIVQQSASSELDVTGLLTVNSGGSTLSNNGGALLDLSGGVGGTGELDLYNNSNTADAITISGADLNTSGKIYNLGSGSSALISANVDSNVTAIVQQSANSELDVTGLLTVNGGGSALSNNGGALLDLSGGVGGTGELDLYNNTSTADAITLSGADINNSGKIYNLGSGSSALISANIGSNVTGITQNSASSELDVTGQLTVNHGTTLSNNGGALLSLTGGVAGTGGSLNLNIYNNSATANGITISGAAVNFTGNITNLGNGPGNVLISASIGTNVTGVIQDSANSSLVLTAANTYTGPTTITAGTLQLGNGTAAGTLSPAGGIVDNAQLTFNEPGTVTQNTTNSFGLISGNGAVTQNGPGTVVLAGVNTYTGNTMVNTGILHLNAGASTASANTYVNAGARLEGYGAVGGNVANAGTVEPGDGPGTMTIAGNYGQGAGGLLLTQVGGRGAGQYSVLAVGGSAALSGTLDLVQLNNFKVQPFDKLAILTAGGGVSGTFPTVNGVSAFTPAGTLITAGIAYDANDVYLVAVQNSFTALPGLTPNQAAVAADLNRAANDPRANALISFLDVQPVANLPYDFDLIAPEELTSLFQIGVSFADVQAANIENHLASVRASDAPPQSSTTVGLLVDGKDSVGLRDGDGKNSPAPAPSGNRWNVWMEGNGDFVRVDGDTNAAGYHFTTGGVTLGGDYRVCDHFVVGIMGGYADTGATLTQGGAVDVNSGRLGIYSTTYGGGFYLNTLATGGYNSYDTHRTALGGIAQGNTDGAEFDGMIGGGYDMHLGNFTWGPVASAQYTNVAINSYGENGSLAPLQINSQSQDSLVSKVGFKLSSVWNINGVAVTPSITAEWEHEYLDSTFALDSQFASGAGNVFTVTGPKIGRDGVVANAGVNVQWTPRLGTYVYYYGEQGRKNYELDSVTGGVSLSF